MLVTSTRIRASCDMHLRRSTKEAELNRLLDDLSTPYLSASSSRVSVARSDEPTRLLEETAISGEMSLGEVSPRSATPQNFPPESVEDNEMYLVTDSSDYMDSIDGEDMSTLPVTPIVTSASLLLTSSVPPVTSSLPVPFLDTSQDMAEPSLAASHDIAEPSLAASQDCDESMDENGDHIYVNRHLVPICLESGDVDLDAVPSDAPTPPETPPQDNYYENLPSESGEVADLYENLPDSIPDPSLSGSHLDTSVSGSHLDPVPDLTGTSFGMSPPNSSSFVFPDEAVGLLEMSNLEERDDLLEDELKPDVAALRKRLLFYFRQDLQHQNIKYCYDMLDKVILTCRKIMRSYY